MAASPGTASTIVVRTEDIIVHNKAGSTGLPTLGADVKIVDPDGDLDDEMSVGETGEIAVSSPSVAMGYWRDPDLTGKKFVGDGGEAATSATLMPMATSGSMVVLTTSSIRVGSRYMQKRSRPRSVVIRKFGIAPSSDAPTANSANVSRPSSSRVTPRPRPKALDQFLRQEQKLERSQGSKGLQFRF